MKAMEIINKVVGATAAYVTSRILSDHSDLETKDIVIISAAAGLGISETVLPLAETASMAAVDKIKEKFSSDDEDFEADFDDDLDDDFFDEVAKDLEEETKTPKAESKKEEVKKEETKEEEAK